ncbi:auxin-responsive protein SAUR32-like [Vicia villosa]|uniref:auxin-responsive protein SAUR32-like n=1 Tax=Vicia villosa TaxID=3911 RepID=UPI00273B9884|nr:auxin-responsive protein SAUR32-like [Vicia villosa]
MSLLKKELNCWATSNELTDPGKRVWGSSKRLYDPQDTSCNGSYGKLSEKFHKKQKGNTKKPPHGCLCVYVGPERQRFVIKIKIFNHPSFKTLLDDVEIEYGYRNDGPLWLPCDVDMFCEALAEIEGHKQSSVSQYSPLSCRSNLSSRDGNYEVFG